jgi:pimeloyl-ACP methyl ester carboxylesterase
MMQGLCPTPPLAIVDFYGCKYFSDPSWSKPHPAFAQIPDQSEEFTSSVFSGSQALTSQPMFIEGKPNLSDARCAWYIQQIKQGTSLSSIVPDGDYGRIDAASQFSSGFPPTYFLHGKPDVFVGSDLSVRAHEELRGLAVESVLVTPGDVGHGFDLQLSDDTAGEELFERLVEPALAWLAKHV